MPDHRDDDLPQPILPPQAESLPRAIPVLPDVSRSSAPQPAPAQPIAVPIQVRGAQRSAALRNRKQRQSQLAVIGGIVVLTLFVVAAAGLGYVFYGDRFSGPETQVAENQPQQPTKKRSAESETKSVASAMPKSPAAAAVSGEATNEPRPAESLSPESARLQKAILESPPENSPTSSEPDSTPAKPATVPKKGAKKKPAAKSSSPTTPAPAPVKSEVTAIDDEEKFFQAIGELYRTDKLLTKKEYPQIRGLFAARFAREHDVQFRQGLGADYDATLVWLNEHPEIRDELYLAIRPGADKIPEVLRLFNELRKQFPDKLVPYASLAIATAVVWDEPQRNVYSYEGLAHHSRSSLPSGMLGGIDNFRYLVAAELWMQGRIQYAPWEFLVHVVNHHTPEAERAWAMQNFLNRRVMFGSCYSDVPYDYDMLKSDGKVAHLNGQEYNLPNMLAYGGICAYQADFAARVGKSIGVSAESVEGTAIDLEGHAWVMWVELKQATPTGLVFSLESHGRYRGDKFYVGTLEDPHTGQRITDRELELRLQTAGSDTVANRQTNLVMQVYPQLCERENLDVNKRLMLLGQIINYSPGCEAAWIEAAKVAREVSGQKQYVKQVMAIYDRLFVTFARVPDFTWKVFDDLAAFEPEIQPRTALYERLLTMYEKSGRPDLACEARLKISDMLVEQDKAALAVEGLAFTIRKFPTEGRYVPKMLDKIEKVCQGFPGSEQKLVQFYVQLLPLIPQMRAGEPSPYALAMFQRAADIFTRHNQPQLAQMARLEHDKIKASREPAN